MTIRQSAALNEHRESGTRFSSLLLSEAGGIQLSYSLPEGRGNGVTEYRTVTVAQKDLPPDVFGDFIQYLHLFYEQIDRARMGRLDGIVKREDG